MRNARLPPISAIPLSADFPMRLQAVQEIAIKSRFRLRIAVNSFSELKGLWKTMGAVRFMLLLGA
jgi:hypothetical protein